MKGRGGMRLFHRVMAFNTVVLVAAAMLLVFSPVTISAPIELEQAALVLAGLVVLLGANALLLQRAFRPLDRLVRRMGSVDLLRPGQRLAVEHDDEVGRVVAAFNEMLERLESERQRSGRRLLAAQEAERSSIARDLHDEVGQLLTGVLLQLEAIDHDDGGREAGAAGRADVEPAKAATRQALQEVRRISRDLRPEMLQDLGLVSALTELATTVERLGGPTIERAFASDLPPLDPDTELAIYRIAQEGITNVVRHAHASHVQVVVERSGRDVVLRICDDGVGIAPAAEQGAGLRNMRERALLVGGSLAIRPRRPRGTEVRLEVQV